MNIKLSRFKCINYKILGQNLEGKIDQVAQIFIKSGMSDLHKKSQEEYERVNIGFKLNSDALEFFCLLQIKS